MHAQQLIKNILVICFTDHKLGYLNKYNHLWDIHGHQGILINLIGFHEHHGRYVFRNIYNFRKEALVYSCKKGT